MRYSEGVALGYDGSGLRPGTCLACATLRDRCAGFIPQDCVVEVAPKPRGSALVLTGFLRTKVRAPAKHILAFKPRNRRAQCDGVAERRLKVLPEIKRRSATHAPPTRFTVG